MAAFGLPELASLNDPSIAVDQAALQRQMALAQALRAQSMNPIETAGRQIGGVAYKISPLEGLAKALQAYQANKADTSNDQSRLALAQRMAQAVNGQLGGATAPATPSAGPQMSTPGNPQFSVPPAQGAPGAAPSGGGPSLAQLMRGGLITDVGGPAMGAAYAKQFEPTDMERQLRAAGIDPTSALGKKIIQDNLAKQNNIPFENIRPGGYSRDPITGEVKQYPQVPIGHQAVADGRGGFTIQPAAGGPQAVATTATAQASGPAQFEPMPTVDAQGNPQPVRSRAQVFGGGAPAAPGAAAPKAAPGIAKLDVVEPSKSGSFVAPPLGTESSQKGLDTSWEALKSANREAQNTKSYLQNIVTAAEKGAIVGPGADRRELIQGMLQLAGIKEDVNTNATTQTQLLNKYSNQIVARLGASGGMSTDAARTILQSAYPGQHMNVEAIREAVGNLSGAQDMTMAKSRFLQDAAIKRDSTTYQQREIQFDQAADPRIWQYKSIRDPEQRKAFARTLMQQDPSLPDRIKKLESLGAL